MKPHRKRRNSSRQGNRVRQGAAQTADVRSRVGPGSCLNGSGPLFHPEDGEKRVKNMGIREKYQITEYCHRFLRDYIREGDVCVDATAGNGGDTEFLCRMAGAGGRVYAFDIQEQALRSTAERLERAGLRGRAELICAGHEQMREYVKEPAAAAVFNLGYLPGGDHTLATRAETTLEAAGQALELLRPGGILSLCIYSGGDTGYEERDALLSWLKELDTRRWLVIVNSFYNRKNDPPLPVFVIRLE